MSRAGALLCKVLTELSIRHLLRTAVCGFTKAPKSVTIQDDLSHAHSQLTAEAMSGNDNGYPSGITEMSVWQADHNGANNHDQRQPANADDALKASAQ